MESKKIMSVFNAEEKHLASISTKEVVKTTTRMTKVQDSSNSITTTATRTTEAANHTNNDETISGKNASTELEGPVDRNKVKKSKSKKQKKSENGETQLISVKSRFNKFDALQNRNLIHVRSSGTGKAQKIFRNPQVEQQTNCRLCMKPVYKMEEVKAEKSIYHKNCFRCQECDKQLKVDNYQSNAGKLYCLIHFKLLFAPKFVEDTEEEKPRKAELIIRESQPVELPPDVLRASTKPDLGLEELQHLNVRTRFQVFENAAQKNSETLKSTPSNAETKSNSKILSKLAKLQQHGIDTNSINVDLRATGQDFSQDEASDSSDKHISDNDSDFEYDAPGGSGDVDIELVRSKKRIPRERPVGLGDAMNDIKSKFENGHMLTKEERREERKQEIQNIRSRLFLGKQAKIKEMYQQAVAESEQGVTSVGKKPDVEIGKAARSIKERFEKGEMFKGKAMDAANNAAYPDDIDVFESAISKKSRSIFMELDANVASDKKTLTANKQPVEQNQHQHQHQLLQSSVKRNSQKDMQISDNGHNQNVVKYDEQPEDVKIATTEVSEKFKFFETYRPKENSKPKFRMTPPREGVVKMPTPDSDENTEEAATRMSPTFSDVLQKTQTTSTMLNKFREMEQRKHVNKMNSMDNNEPKPLKCFTPPPDGNFRRFRDQDSDDDEEFDSESDDASEENESEEGDNQRQTSWQAGIPDDEALKEVKAAARAKQLRAKFEKWQNNETQRELNDSQVDIYSQHVSDDSTIESTKTIRERFENMKNLEKKSPSGPRYQVNRFV